MLQAEKEKKKEEKAKKRKKKIRQVSEKRQTQLAIYRKKRGEYMGSVKVCEFKGCNHKPQDLHHKNGRVGAMVFNTAYFMAVCRVHHNWIHENPAEAREMDYLI